MFGDENAKDWSIDLYPRGGDPDAPPTRFLELHFSDDNKTLQVKRLGTDGKLQTFEVAIQGPGDVRRIFAAEVLAVICAQANANFRQQGRETTQAAPISFSPEGHVVSEIYQRGVLFRRAVFDPHALKLVVTGENGVTLTSSGVPDVSELPLVLAKVMGVKLPLGS